MPSGTSQDRAHISRSLAHCRQRTTTTLGTSCSTQFAISMKGQSQSEGILITRKHLCPKESGIHTFPPLPTLNFAIRGISRYLCPHRRIHKTFVVLQTIECDIALAGVAVFRFWFSCCMRPRAPVRRRSARSRRKKGLLLLLLMLRQSYADGSPYDCLTSVSRSTGAPYYSLNVSNSKTQNLYIRNSIITLIHI